MTDPFDPDPLEPFDPLEYELRRSLAERAQDAPDAGALTERLLAAGVDTPRGGWNTWALPVVAAACVALIVGIVLVVVRPGHSDRSPDAVDRPSRPVPVTSPVAPAPTPSSAPATSPSPTGTGSSSVLQNVRVADLTFIGENSGWALASADCSTGSGRCSALLRTTDGTTWSGQPDLPFRVPGDGSCPATTCVTHLRFANDSVGYAFGPDALYLTVDGAQSWHKQAGGADALETLDNNVIRVSVLGTGPPSLLTAAVGGTSWTSRSTAGFPTRPLGVSLGRAGRAAILAFTRFDPASATGRGQAGVLLRSGDDGLTWTSAGDPCATGTAGQTDVLTAAALAEDGAVVADCATRSTANQFQLAGHTIVSTNGGATFTRSPGGGTLRPAGALGAASASVQLVVPVGQTPLYRSTDRGRSWAKVAGVTAANVGFLGFESATVGRLVTGAGQNIWTTRDAGASWTEISF